MLCTGKVTAEGLKDCYNTAGGFIGYDSSSTITGCYSTGDVRASDSCGYGSYAGGFMGRGYDTVIIKSFACGNVIAADTTKVSDYPGCYSGGFAGYIEFETADTSLYSTVSSIINCYARGSAESSSNTKTYAGGFSGYGDKAHFKSCYSTGKASASTSSSSSLKVSGGFIAWEAIQAPIPILILTLQDYQVMTPKPHHGLPVMPA
jgi:hypothetical protein